ncbi:MAG TPA: sigma-54 dependent transcriptional regulator [Thermoanaerobaculia bacterium]|nr:sigma-54 dependent transcriptional regulator [Thermoanaerobaculia bacterium]HUM29089.1 sigma-54 dependent transcriptional regulator [Thermoanaerobaculia bacterium]HXK67466.1 sigma-54 dependent transcriptional regulator [Thermoanaerobaculia bacterium]
MDRILVVEDRRSLLKILSEVLGDRGYEVVGASSGTQALDLLRKERFSLVLTDLKLPGADGLEVLTSAREEDPDLPVVIITAFGTVETAVEAMKKGATEFLLKPVDHEFLSLIVDRIIEKQRIYRENILLKEEHARNFGFPTIVGSSPIMDHLSREVQKVAATEVSVLLSGESGTGKELFARAIHSLSPRKDKPFVAINCAAIPDTLIENELFGHEKGAYTGASSRQMGKFELAHTGTIFLDEISELGMNVQSKILRVIQERTFERIGGLQTIQVDVRIIAATNQDLQKAVREHRFREDLFYRLSVFPVFIPPLRSRPTDIPILAEHFLKKYSAEMGRRSLSFGKSAMEKLRNHGWPGNVRELQNMIERSVILSETDTIESDDIQLAMEDPKESSLLTQIGLEGSLEEILTRAGTALEKEILRQVLLQEKQDLTRTANRLSLTLRALQRKILDYGL